MRSRGSAANALWCIQSRGDVSGGASRIEEPPLTN